MDLNWFTDLGHLARTGNFSQAAERSNISQSAFSRRIKALEAWVGTELVDRSRHPVRLTSAGEQMLEAGEQAVGRIEAERTQIREAQTLPDRYVVTFGAQHSIGWRFFPAWQQAFEAEFGPFLSRLRADNLPGCIDDLRRNELDFVIAYESPFAKSIEPFGSLESILIGTDALVPVCKLDDGGKPLFSLDNLSLYQVPYLRFGPAAPISSHVEPLLDRFGLNQYLAVVYENSMAGALRIRARDGAGVAWLPRSLVLPDLENGRMSVIGPREWQIDLEIRLHRLRDNANPLTEKIWEFLADREQQPLTVV